MPAEPEVPESFRTWRARNWGELRAIWGGLMPELAGRKSLERRFRSQLLTPQYAGAVFERWMLEAFRLSGAAVRESYVVPMPDSAAPREQIDGSLTEGWQGFLIESKFWPSNVDFDPIAVLHVLVEQRPVGTLGLFFSAFGYTPPAVELAGRLRPIRVLLFDQNDLLWAMKPGHGMMKLVRERWIFAVQYGGPFLPRPG
jgi:hypothetical protein